MKSQIADRAINIANYFLNNKTTIRNTANEFGVAKTTTHYDLTKVLPQINISLSKQVRDLLDLNKSERAIRGGMATKLNKSKKEIKPKFNFNQIVFFVQRLDKKAWVDPVGSAVTEISINKYNKFEYTLYHSYNKELLKVKEKDVFDTLKEAEKHAFKIF